MPSRAVASLFAALLAIAASPAPAAALEDCQARAGWTAPLLEPAGELVALVNAHRTGRGLAPLAVSPALTAAAEWKARDMAANGYLDHVDRGPPADRTPAERIQACGVPPQAMVGENLAEGFGTAAGVVQAWLASDGHRGNLEHTSFTATGAGVARSAAGTLYWTQDFGAPPGAGLPGPAPAPLSGRLGAGADRPPGSSAPATAPLDAAHAVACRRVRRAARCRLVLGSGPVTVRAWLLRDRRILARGVRHARAAGTTRIRLRARRALRPGRMLLRLRVGEALVRLVVHLR